MHITDITYIIIEALFAKTQGWVQLNVNPIILEVFRSPGFCVCIACFRGL